MRTRDLAAVRDEQLVFVVRVGPMSATSSWRILLLIYELE